MTAVVIDPGLFLFEVPTQQELRAKLARIRQLREIHLRAEWVKLVLPKRTIGLLAKHNLYPAFNGIAAALAKHALNTVFTPHDISYAVGQLLQAKAMEDYSCAEDAAWDRFEVNPDIFPLHANEYLDAELQVVMSVDAAVTGACRQISGMVSVFDAESIKPLANVTLVEPDILPGFMPIEMPREVSVEIRQIRNFEDLCSILDPECLWVLAGSAVAAKAAIQLHCRNELKQSGGYQRWDTIPKFRLGEGFFESVKRNPQSSSVIFRKSSLLILDSPNIESRPLMSSEEANAKQVRRERDGALAFRLHLSKSHEAMRLMYWRLVDGTKELANVGTKAELIILEGTAEKAV